MRSVGKAGELASEAAGVERAVEEILEALDRDFGRYRPTLKTVESIAWELGLEGDPKALARKALKEARSRVEQVVEGLRKSLKTPLPLPSKVREALERGDSWELIPHYLFPGRMLMSPKGAGARGPIPVPSSLDLLGIWPREVTLEGSKGGNVAFVVEGPYFLFARRGYAFFRARELDHLREATDLVTAFRPLFDAIGLSGLEEALRALPELKGGEVRTQGPYVLARRRGSSTGNLWALGRGGLFGNPLLDGAFLVGGRVDLHYPEDLKISFDVEVRVEGEGSLKTRLTVEIKELKVRWGGEAVFCADPSLRAKGTNGDLPQTLLLRALYLRLGRRYAPVGWTPRMQALVGELASSDNPIEAPKDPEFFRRVHLRALASF
jgi:hypothetical protein